VSVRGNKDIRTEIFPHAYHDRPSVKFVGAEHDRWQIGEFLRAVADETLA
jgi:hypothetical protein